jgi:hypothetical protein
MKLARVLGPLALVALVYVIGAAEPRAGLYLAALGAFLVARWPS